MERIFTKNIGKRFKKGDVKDYPPIVWANIEKSAKANLESFSRPADLKVQEMVK